MSAPAAGEKPAAGPERALESATSGQFECRNPALRNQTIEIRSLTGNRCLDQRCLRTLYQMKDPDLMATLQLVRSILAERLTEIE